MSGDTKEIRLRFTARDERVLAWLAEQSNQQVSIRLALEEFIAHHGSGDAVVALVTRRETTDSSAPSADGTQSAQGVSGTQAEPVGQEAVSAPPEAGTPAPAAPTQTSPPGDHRSTTGRRLDDLDMDNLMSGT